MKDKRKIKLVLAFAYLTVVIFLFDFFLSKTKTNGVWEWLFSSFVFFLIGPLILVKLVFKEKIREYFISFDFNKKDLLLTFFCSLLYIFTILFSVLYLNWKNYLPVSSWVLGGVDFLLFVDLVLVPIVLFSKEFFFRGYLLKTLLVIFGVFTALVCQALFNLFFDFYLTGFSIAWQQGLLLFLFYLFLGIVAWKNRSVAVSFFLSWVHVLLVDIYFIYQATNSVG